MAGTPDGAPPGYGLGAFQQAAAWQGAQAQGYLQQVGQMLGAPTGPLGVGAYQGYQTTAPQGLYVMGRDGLQFYPQGQPARLSDAEFAEEYYDQCFGTSRTPQERAYELLMEHLTDDEKNEWWDTGRVTVTGKSGRRYWISGSDCGRDDGHTFCVYIGMGECPAEDRVLGLKLAIEADEALFLKTAVDRGVSGQAQGQWADIQRAAMEGGLVAMNEIFNAAIGQYHGVVFHENTQRVPDSMWRRAHQRIKDWYYDIVTNATP